MTKNLAERVQGMSPFDKRAAIQADIQRELVRIEAERDVQVIMAVESGSRVWGFASADSDFDVRFLYVHPRDHYLTVWDQRDVIEWRTEDPSLDIAGWDIKKALRLMARGNASVAEWLRSLMVYRWLLPRVYDLMQFEAKIDPRGYAWHYYGMAQGNYCKYLKGRAEVLHKKYLYVLRPIAIAALLLDGEPPAMALFSDMLSHLPRMDESMEGAVESLIYQKREGQEVMEGPANEQLNDYIEREIGLIKERLVGVPSGLPQDQYGEADAVFHAILGRCAEGS